MDSRHFDALTRTLTEAGTRRGLLGLLATLPVLGGLIALLAGDDADAQGRRRRRKKRHKHGRGRRRQHHNKTKPKFNAFGCVDVGKFCKNSGQCCSGICQGKKGKKKCQAHDTGGCQPGHSIGDCGGQSVTCPDNSEGQCATTTGKSAFCFEVKFQPVPPCTRDADCEGGGFPGAACVLCGDGTTCAVSFV
jgi:hypothetical protein